MKSLTEKIATPAGVGVICGLFALCVLTATLPRAALTYDEAAYYFDDAKKAGRWVERGAKLSKTGIENGWQVESGHPPGLRLPAGVSWLLLCEKSRLLRADIALRLPYVIAAAAAVGLLAGWAAAVFSPFAGVCAAAAFLSFPRWFAHAHLATPDNSATAFWLFAGFALWTLKKRGGTGLAAGILVGITLSCKLNNAFSAAALLLWFAAVRPRNARQVVVVCLVAASVFFIAWPWLWHGPLVRMHSLAELHKTAIRPLSLWFGEIRTPPHLYPFLMTALTFPVLSLAFSVAGLIQGVTLDRARRSFIGFAFICAATPIMQTIAASGVVGYYDGIRHGLPAFPYLAMLSGAAAHYLRGFFMTRSSSAFLNSAVAAILFLMLSFEGTTGIVDTWPYSLSFFNANVGGARGAHESGLEATYWGDPYAGVPPWANGALPREACILAFPFDNILRAYQEHGLLRRDIRILATGSAGELAGCESLTIIVYGRMGMMSPRQLALWQRPTDNFRVEVDGVPLLRAFHLRRAPSE